MLIPRIPPLSKFEDTLQIRESLANKVISLQVANEKKKEKIRETLILEEEAKKKRKQRMNKIANATKSIFNYVLMLCIVVFIFAIVDTGLTDLIIYLSSFSINWVKVMCFLVAFIITSILVLIMSLIIYLTEKWAKEEHKKWYYWTLLPIYYISTKNLFIYFSYAPKNAISHDNPLSVSCRSGSRVPPCVSCLPTVLRPTPTAGRQPTHRAFFHPHKAFRSPALACPFCGSYRFSARFPYHPEPPGSSMLPDKDLTRG